MQTHLVPPPQPDRVSSAARFLGTFLGSLIALLLSHLAQADLVEMKNGDRYAGDVLKLDERLLTLRNDNLGTVELPRARVLRIHLGAISAEDVAPASASLASPPETEEGAPRPQIKRMKDLLGEIQKSGIDRGLIEQVQAQFLGTAGPEANRKFEGMLQGLLGGTLNVRDIQREAGHAATQLRELKQDLGDDSGGMLDVYLGILENFLDRSEPAPPAGESESESEPKPEATSEAPQRED